MARVAYLDSSAIVKTIVEEPESRALGRFLRRFEIQASAELARAEVLRAVRRLEPTAVTRVFQTFETFVLLEVDQPLLDAAGLLDPLELRTLDAIHLTAARLLSPQLDALVTYDVRMAAAGGLLGLPIEAPR